MYNIYIYKANKMNEWNNFYGMFLDIIFSLLDRHVFKVTF